MTKGNLFDPNANLFDVEMAEAALGIDEENREGIKYAAALDLVCAHLGITEEEIEAAYEQRLKNMVSEAADSLRVIAGEK